MSETCRVLYQKNLRISVSRWLSLQECTTMHGPLNVKLPFFPLKCSNNCNSFLPA